MAAGDAWVMDIIWHTMIIAGKWLVSFWRHWSMELLLGASFVTQLVLSMFAGFRWRGASKALRRIIWFFYVGAGYVATTALGNLSITGSSSSGERQLLAFWAPFFLLHLGGPDNITAYKFEDNQLSKRSVLELVVQVWGTLIVVYNYSASGSWALIAAAWSMFLVCVARHVERTLALHRANLGTIRRSLKLSRRHHRNHMFAAADNTALLMRAHSLFHICKHALVESLVEEELDDDQAAQTRKELFELKWHQLFKVMEMELSIMYDFLYTKASVIYTWHGYGIRALSPLATLASFVLVELSNQGGRKNKLSDVVITRFLLSATFILEMLSLLKALGSSWTGFMICTRLRPSWIRHQVFCTSRWHRLRLALSSLGLLAKYVRGQQQVADGEKDHVNDHRRWSGNIGQLNLFQRVTCGPLEKEQELFWAGNQEQIKPDVKRAVGKKLPQKVIDFRGELKEMGAGKGQEKVKLAAQFRTKRGQKTLRDYGLLGGLRQSLGNELQVAILTWHIGTNIFLNISDKAKASDQVASGKGNKDKEAQLVKAIRTLSNYMVYLLGERPHMLPGLVTRQLLELTRRDLVDIWNNPNHAAIKVGETATRQEQLARILHSGNFDSEQINTYLGEAIKLGRTLIENDKEVFFKEKEKEKKKGIVEVILEVWVDMLFYASYRCSKESHAKQLAYGGELTTIVWLLAEHAGLFVVPKPRKKQGNETT